MEFYRVCLIILYSISALCSLPHLITHIRRLSFREIPLRSKVAYSVYWFNYCFMVLVMLIWPIWILIRSRTTVWQVIETSGLILIVKFIYIGLDLTTRILLRHDFLVVCFDAFHLFVLLPMIILTFLLVRRVKKRELHPELV